MLTNPKSERIKGLASLKQKQARSETGLFLLEGPQGLSEAPANLAKLVLVSESASDRVQFHVERLAASGVEIQRATDEVIAKVADTNSPQGVVVVCNQPGWSIDSVTQPKLLGILENPSDPGNLGTIIRTADAAGVDALCVVEPAVDYYNPKVVRATAGSIFNVPLFSFPNLAVLGEALQRWSVQVFGATAEGIDLRSPTITLASPTAWIFGNEAHGLSQQARAMCDYQVSIPIFGKAESLNLATAATVCLYQSSLALQRKE